MLNSCPGNRGSGMLQSFCPGLTSGAVGEHSHGEVDLRGCAVPGGADGVVPGFQDRELGEQEAGRHPQGRELPQHLQECGTVGELPRVVLQGLKGKGGVSNSGHLPTSPHTEGRGCHKPVFIHSFTRSRPPSTNTLKCLALSRVLLSWREKIGCFLSWKDSGQRAAFI